MTAILATLLLALPTGWVRVAGAIWFKHGELTMYTCEMPSGERKYVCWVVAYHVDPLDVAGSYISGSGKVNCPPKERWATEEPAIVLPCPFECDHYQIEVSP